MQDRSTRWHPRAFFVATAIAAAGAGVLVYWTSTARPMWVDEEMLALNVRDHGFRQLAGALWLDQSAPFGWLVLERLIVIVAGTGERAVRTLTALFGMGTLAAAWWIGRRWMTPIGAAVLVALCAAGEWLVFFTLELKHYSADAAGALIVPALAARALDAADASAFRARLLQWWGAAAVLMWFSNGALFVTPGCAIVLLAAVLQRNDVRAAGAHVSGGLIWLGSFAAIYAAVLRHALANAYLRNYWAFAFPPVAEGIGPTVAWLGSAVAPFAVKPVGSGQPWLFWAAYLVGIVFAIARRSTIAITFATVPIAGVALALAHFVPTFERLAIWLVPSVYVGAALCADAAVDLIAPPSTSTTPRGRGLRVAAGVASAVIVASASADIVRRGVFAIGHRPASNYGLDDRSSVRWLIDEHKPGDAVMSTHYGLAAIWWYGRVDVGDAARSGRLDDGTPLYEIHHVAAADECRRWNAALDSIARDRARVVVYLGFRMNVEPEGFDRLVLEEFGRRWPLVGYKEYAEASRVAVFDVRAAASGPLVIPSRPNSSSETVAPTPSGCVSVTPARRW